MEQYIKRAEEKLYSVHYLRKRLLTYTERLRKLQLRSGTDSTSEIESVKTNILETQYEIEDITFVVEQLSPDEQILIRLWYFEKLPKKELCAKLFISSVSALYKRKDKALKNFYNIFPW